jgi:tRNA/rRNA methyltransferase
MTEAQPALSQVAVVLVRPQLSENIGTTARAVANMGLGRLILVEPHRQETDIILAAATRLAHGLVENITVFDTLREALADFHYVVGTTARRGSDRGPFYSPRSLAPEVLSRTRSGRAALVFGPERSGLTTPELRLCQAVVSIPTADPKASSLNLAQAVLILGYELLLEATHQAIAAQPPATAGIKPAPMVEVNDMYDDLERTLTTIGFLPDRNSGHWVMSFKRIFNRSGLTHGDCNLFRGVCRQIDWAIRHPDKLNLEPGTPDGD